MTGTDAQTIVDEAKGNAQVEPQLVVVLDTDPGIRWALEKGLERSGYRVQTAGTVGEALGFVYEGSVSAVVMELLPEAGLTLDVLANLLDTPKPPRIICVSVDANPQDVIECMRRGAADFLPKPFSLSEVRAALKRALADDAEQRSIRRPGRAAHQETDGSFLIGISPCIQELRSIIRQIAQTDLNCLIRGESGTGKDMVAREVHRLSLRKDKPFVKVNCTALPEQLLESELFGYEKGAFTGAVTSKPGRFELANRGIIFLDEIGDLHHSLQAKLLQVIEHKEFTKLGGRAGQQVDVQILAATNVDLEQKTKEGSFRHDLYFRLNEVSIWVPSLGQRKEDVPLLVRHFIQKHGRYAGGPSIEVNGEDLNALTQHDWPGNVRELESTIKRWLALGKKSLHAQRQSVDASRGPDTASARANAAASPEPKEEQQTPALSPEEERRLLLKTLEENQWNRRKAADALGMSYQTLRRRIEKFELDKR